MNYMEQVAEMLGVKLGEEFDIMDDNGMVIHYYKLTKLGLVDVISQIHRHTTLTKLLTGECTIKKKPWKPQMEEAYYWIDQYGNLNYEYWNDDSIDLNRYKIGNCYRTREEAESHKEEWKAWYERDEQIDVLGNNKQTA